MKKIDFSAVPSPSYVVDERLLTKNLELLKSVQDRTGCSILLALKGFSMHSTFPLVGQYLKGLLLVPFSRLNLDLKKWEKKYMYMHLHM